MMPPKTKSAALAALAFAFAFASSCQRHTEEAPPPADAEFRSGGGGSPPPGLELEVEALRLADDVFDTSTAVGAVPGKAEVDRFGNATYRIPIDVAPGPAGLVPNLAIAYRSSGAAGNGNLGVGFELDGFSSIRRCTGNVDIDGAYEPLTFGDDDHLCLDGNRLVLYAGTTGKDGAEYRPLRDPFSKIVLHGDIGVMGTTFEVFERSGYISTYGETVATIGRPDAGNPDVQLPFVWGLRERRDRFGNAIRYDYTKPGFTEGGGGHAELRPSAIAYGGTGTESSKRHVVFSYESRGDDVAGYWFGDRHGHQERLSEITVEGPSGELLFTYELTYEGDNAADNYKNRRSHLVALTKCDREHTCLPATTFEWNSVPDDQYALVPLGDFSQGPANEDILEAQALLAEASRTVTGDFDGDTQQEILFWQPAEDPEEYTWFYWWTGFTHSVSELPVYVIEEYGQPLVTHQELMATAPFMQVGPLSAPSQHYLGAPISPFAATVNNDIRTDVVMPIRPGGDGVDANDHPYAAGFRVAQGVGLGELGWTTVDDGSAGNIYQMVPTDHEGDGLTDIWLCRGAGYKTATWVLAHAEPQIEPSDPWAYSFHDTQVGCSAHDETHVLSLRGGPPSLLVVPAYPTDPASQSSPSASGYETGADRIPEVDRIWYAELRYELGTGEGQLVQTDLPRDIYQRYHDQHCKNGFALAMGQPPAWTAGPSKDRVQDVNGDGYPDILRFELDAGDGVADLQAIQTGLPDENSAWTVNTETDPGGVNTYDCEPEIETQTGGQIVLYLNTGDGFAPPAVVHEFAGNAHANFWLNFVGAFSHDLNFDGLSDLYMPSGGLGDDSDWKVLLANGTGGFHSTPIPVQFTAEAEWPGYRSDTDWLDQLDASRQTRILMRMGHGAAPDVFFVGEPDMGPGDANWLVDEWDAHWGFQGDYERVARITDGVGAEAIFTYDAVAAPETGELYPLAGSPRSHVVVDTYTRNEHGIPCEDSGNKCLVTEYAYSGATSDRLNGGFVGWQYVTSTTEDRVIQLEYDFSHHSVVPGRPYSALPKREMHRRLMANNGGDLDDAHLVCTTREFAVLSQTIAGGVVYSSWASDVATELAVVPGAESDCDDVTGLYRYRQQFSTEDRDEFGTVTETTSSVAGGDSSTTTNARIVNDTSTWLVGKPEITTTSVCTSSNVCQTNRVDAAWSSVTGAPVSFTREPLKPDAKVITSFRYDARGNVTETHVRGDGATRSTYTTWDAEGVNPLDRTNPLGHKVYFAHEETSGFLYGVVDANGVTDYRRIDGFARPTVSERRSSPLGAHDGAPVYTSYEGGDAGLTGSAIRAVEHHATGQRIEVDYDSGNRPLRRSWFGVGPSTAHSIGQIPAGDRVFQEYAYDQWGRMVRTSLPQWVGSMPEGFTTTSWNSLDQRTAIEAPNGATETFEYYMSGVADGGYAGIQETRTDADQHETVTLSDLQGHVKRVEEPTGGWTCWTHGPGGRAETIRRNCAPSANGPEPTTTLGYDALGRVASVEDPAVGLRTFTYTAFDEVETIIDGNDEVTAFTYDALGRVELKGNADGLAEFTYDTERLGYLSEGLSEDGIAHSYTYDAFGRIASETLTVEVIPGTLYTPTFGYEYGPGGRIAQINYPEDGAFGAFGIRYEYDAAGHGRGVYEPGSAQREWLFEIGSAAGMVRQERFHNTALTVRAYDPETLRPEAIRTFWNGTSVQNLGYDWSPHGDLTRRSDLALHGQEEAFEYDSLHRLTSATVTKGGVPSVTGVAYDVLGNITSKTDVGGYEYDSDGMLESYGNPGGQAVDHDDAGQILSLGSTDHLTWSASGLVRTVDAATDLVTLRYGPDGDRVLRFSTSEAAWTLSFGDLYELRLNAAGAPLSATRRVRSPGGRIIEQEVEMAGGSTSKQTIHDDHLGSTSVVINDAGPPRTLAYDAWGTARSGDDWTQPSALQLGGIGAGFTGHRAKLDGDLMDMRGRMYHPEIARFVSPDPLVADPLSVQGYNRFSYVGNRPLRNTDPTGWEEKRIEPEPGTGTPDVARPGGVGFSGDGWSGNITCDEGCVTIVFYEVPDILGLTTNGLDSVGGGGNARTPGSNLRELSPGVSLNPRAIINDFTTKWMDNFDGTIVAYGMAVGERGMAIGNTVLFAANDPLGFAEGVLDGVAADVFNVLSAPGDIYEEVAEGDAAGAFSRHASASGSAWNLAAIGVVGAKVVTAAEAGAGIAALEQHTVRVSSARYPETAAHIRDAQAAGHPSVLTIDRAGAGVRRSQALSGHSRVSGSQLDEYPPAMFREGGQGASVRAVAPGDNMGAGACIGNQCRGLPDGSRVRIVVE